MIDKLVTSTNWLLDERDQDVAVQAYRRTREIWSKFDPGVILRPEALRGGNVARDTQILNYTRTKEIGAIHHATSTCKLLPNERN
jgi:GMC oxidoreductase